MQQHGCSWPCAIVLQEERAHPGLAHLGAHLSSEPWRPYKTFSNSSLTQERWELMSLQSTWWDEGLEEKLLFISLKWVLIWLQFELLNFRVIKQMSPHKVYCNPRQTELLKFGGKWQVQQVLQWRGGGKATSLLKSTLRRTAQEHRHILLPAWSAMYGFGFLLGDMGKDTRALYGVPQSSSPY